MKIFLKIITVLLVLILGALCFVSFFPYAEKVEQVPVEGSADWMADVSGKLYLNEIWMPGTHDTASNHVQLAYMSRCQTLDIKTQLENGCRVLDMRLGVKDDKVILYHGFLKCKTDPMPWSPDLTMEDVLDQCYAFLEEHPSETVVFISKLEHGNDSGDLQGRINKHISQHLDMWYIDSSIPKLDDCRGKIVLMRRYPDSLGLGSNAGISIYWAKQDGNGDVSLNSAVEPQETFNLFVQDRYKYGTLDKWTAFTAGLANTANTDELLKKYAEDNGRSEDFLKLPVLHMNYLSTNGTPKYGHPYTYAKDLNPLFMDLDLSPFNPNWVLIDFANAEIMEHIYSMNFE